MGTRARINIVDDGEIICSIYRQYDGYPEGLGKDIARFVGGITVVNGYGSNPVAQANGMGCLAAQLIGHLKQGKIGNVYMRDTSPESHGEEYCYTLSESNGRVMLRVNEGHMTAFGLPGDKESDMQIIYNGDAATFATLDAEELENWAAEQADKSKRRRKAS
jgi:hypothetical protein